MELSPRQMCEVFENLGFAGFNLRDYSVELEKFLSSAVENTAKTYVIDVVPGGLEDGLNLSHFCSCETTRRICPFIV